MIKFNERVNMIRFVFWKDFSVFWYYLEVSMIGKRGLGRGCCINILGYDIDLF